ncbi:hypothetical protein NQD34_008578, partial [Periophthalmus magnuspinnatus]
WRRHKNHLKDPVANEGDGECLVVADISTSRLVCVANEIRLFVIPHVFSCNAQNQHPKYEQDSQPYLSNHSGVDMDLLQNPPKEVPVSHGSLYFS